MFGDFQCTQQQQQQLRASHFCCAVLCGTASHVLVLLLLARGHLQSEWSRGQHVNCTDSAVRITHLPSGVVVSQQDERSQHKNKAKAMKILRARLYEEEQRRLNSERSADRKNQVGSGDRSERIRTYNYPQGRVSDHRINLTLYKIAQIMEGEALDEMIDALITEDQAAKLSAESGDDV